MKIEALKKIKLPDKPGVYFFLGPLKHSERGLGLSKRGEGGLKGREILYIGKATSLHNRVRSYMSKGLFDMRGPLIEKMAEEANKIDWQVTDSALEAMILEANLIKKHQPKYNTKEKSDKSFNYVCITKELLPKVVIARASDLKNFSIRKFLSGKVFGPYPNGSQLKEAVKIIRRIFPFLDDKSKNYIEFYRQINLAPDLNNQKLYLQNIKNIKLFFSGKKKQIFKNLEKEMNAYSKTREFEKAGEIKRQLFALQHINDVALIKNNSETGNRIFVSEGPTLFPLMRPKKGAGSKILLPISLFRIEAYDIAHMGGKNMTGVMIVLEDRQAVKSEYRKFKIRTQDSANDIGALKEVLERRLAHKEWTYPDLIVVDGGAAQVNAAKNVLRKINANIPIVAVVKNERHRPKNILGDKSLAAEYEKEILLANSEAHRFAIAYHKNIRNKNFLG